MTSVIDHGRQISILPNESKIYIVDAMLVPEARDRTLGA